MNQRISCRRSRSMTALAARCASLLALLAFAGCQRAVLYPAGPVGGADLHHPDRLCLPSCWRSSCRRSWRRLAVAWWFRASNTSARYLPDLVYSGRLELVVWSIPLLVIMFLGGVAWVGSHDLDPARPLESKTRAARRSRWSRSIGSGCSSTRTRRSPASTSWSFRPACRCSFQLTSASVMNAFFVPQLGSMIYTMNGMATQLNLQADAPGTFAGLSEPLQRGRLLRHALRRARGAGRTLRRLGQRHSPRRGPALDLAELRRAGEAER